MFGVSSMGRVMMGSATMENGGMTDHEVSES